MAKSHNTYPSGKQHSNIIRTVFILAIDQIRQNPHVLNVIHTRQSIHHKAEPNSNVEYTVPTAMYARLFSNDRTFPLETVQIKTQELKREEDIGEAIIHVGPYADEYARSVYTLAFTIANHIYFRNGAYKPETEEGRALLAHEMTHVAQYKNKPLADNRTNAELEHEAEAIEKTEEYSTEKKYELIIDGKTYKMKENQYKQFMSELQEKVEQRLQSRSYIMSEQNYLKLLCTYENMLKRKELPWQN